MNEEIILTEKQLEIINGALLGDGSLIKPKNGVNAYFTYLSKSKEHVEFVCKELIEYVIPSHNIVYSEIFDTRTNKTYSRYDYRSISNPSFTNIYDKWYINNKKIIPLDLKLSPTICLIWYLGDGSLTGGLGHQQIMLCTDNFQKQELETIILPQLQQFNATLQQHGNNHWRIRIPRIKAYDFLQYIGECPIDEYKHKWNLQAYSRKPLKFEPEIEKQIIQAYNDGCSPGTIAIYFKRDRTTILNCLSKYGLDTTKNKGSRKKVNINES